MRIEVQKLQHNSTFSTRYTLNYLKTMLINYGKTAFILEHDK